jgi:hypothetical protein
VATEAAWLGGKMCVTKKKLWKRVKKLLTGIGLLMEGTWLLKTSFRGSLWEKVQIVGC